MPLTTQDENRQLVSRATFNRHENLGSRPPVQDGGTARLGRKMSSTQGLSVVFNVIVGVGILQNTTYAISVAGSGAILAFLLVAVIVGCVVESTVEMVAVFPIRNAMTTYIAYFVDDDWGRIIGLIYWFVYATLLATTITSALGLLSNYFDLVPAVSIVASFGITATLIMLNILPMRWFSWVSCGFGIIKICLLVATIVVTTWAASEIPSSGSRQYGFGGTHDLVTNDRQAICLAISLAVYSFVGVESIAVTASESTNVRAGTRRFAYMFWMVTIAILWILGACYLGLGRVNRWMVAYPREGLGGFIQYANNQTDHAVAAPFAIIKELGVAASYSKVYVIFHAISIIGAANSILFVASRYLFGLAFHSIARQGLIRSAKRSLTTLSPQSNVPIVAVLTSAICLLWVNLLNTAQVGSKSVFSLAQVFSSMLSTGVVLMWASLCLASLKFQGYHQTYRKDLDVETNSMLIVTKSRRWSCFSPQPFLSYVGLCGCLLMIVVFNGAALWNNSEEFEANFMGAYLVPIVVATTWLTVKLKRFLNGAQNGDIQRIWTNREDRSSSTFASDVRRVLFGPVITLERYRELVSKLASRVDAATKAADRGVTPAPTQSGIGDKVSSWSSPHSDTNLEPWNKHGKASPALEFYQYPRFDHANSHPQDTYLPVARSVNHAEKPSTPTDIDDPRCEVYRSSDSISKPLAVEPELIAAPSRAPRYVYGVSLSRESDVIHELD